MRFRSVGLNPCLRLAAVGAAFVTVPTAASTAATIAPLQSCPAVVKPSVGGLSVTPLVRVNFDKTYGSVEGKASFVVRATPSDTPGSTVVDLSAIDLFTGRQLLGSKLAVPRSSGCARVTVWLGELSLRSSYLQNRKLYALRAVIDGERRQGLDVYFGGVTALFATY